jgi:hypothetical protein
LKVNQLRIQFTNKPITAWAGLAAIVAKLLEALEFRSWVESTLAIGERSNNVKGVYEKVLTYLPDRTLRGRLFQPPLMVRP